jgi:hypothetical protein
MATDIPWTMRPGDRILRRELHDIYGGGRQGGMEPSAKTRNVFLFTDEETGKRNGYTHDGWHADRTFHYTGEGRFGDQQMTNGNRATRDHLRDGRALRLFQKDGTSVVYIGEFEIPEDDAHVEIAESLDAEQRDRRNVFVFRLRPIDEVTAELGPVAPSEPEFVARTVPIEASNVETFVRQHLPVSESVESVRREAALVERYVSWLFVNGGQTATRNAIPLPGGTLMYTDVFVNETSELLEAKASASREHVRVALGQILDYARYVEHESIAVLVPSRPADDMIALLIAHGVGCVWESSPRVFEGRRPANFAQ